MQLLKVDKAHLGQADPFILKANGRYYIYVTGHDAVYAYHSDNLFSGWEYYGPVFKYNKEYVEDYWAPSVIELGGKFYMYNSFEYLNETPDKGGHTQTMFVSEAESPLGPFTNAQQILKPFSIDSHIVKNENGLFLFYSTNRFEGGRIGTHIVVDRMLDPRTPEGKPKLVVEPTLDEEIYRKNRYKLGQHWHTIEGACYFHEGDYHYVLYSGNCYEKPTYYVGYAMAKTSETDLTKIHFKKYPNDSTYCPLLRKNEFEEGTGHNSLIKENGQWYMVYHARDYDFDPEISVFDARNARICKLNIAEDGTLSVERYKDKV